MKFSHFFIDRPIFATVMSLILVLIGAISFLSLPVTQYPEVAPPTIQVSASYPGANAETVAETVATPIEQEINGVQGMLYMLSQSTNDGRMSLTITFALGTDLDEAQVLVQNRVAIAEPRLPQEVRQLGVVTQKNSPDLMMVIHLNSPDGTYDQLYISNYALLQIRDRLSRIDGVGDTIIFGARDYSMRVWLDPERMASVDLTAGDVVGALRAQNVQVASGILNQTPQPSPGAFEINVQTLGRLTEPDQFADIIVKTDPTGRLTRLRDVARVELGAQDYQTNSYLDDREAVAIAIFQRPGSNALQTSDEVQALIAELSESFPQGLAYEIVYNPTNFIEQSINSVYETIFQAAALVVLVIFIFLQSLRASLIPIIAIPISLIGTFAVMAAFGFSLNNLTLFGLVLAIGIVVDDAIVVVENLERNLTGGLAVKDAVRKSMDEVGGALIATSLVLVAVFLPTAFVGGISGQFYSQFGLTIAVATVLSTVVSLTLSPAMCAVLMKPPQEGARKQLKPWERPLNLFFRGFNAGFDRLAGGYRRAISKIVRFSLIMVLLYAGLLGLTAWQFQRTPTGFIPAQDQGYFIVSVQLPPGASLARTDAVVQEASEIIRGVEGIAHAVSFAGFSGATFTNATNAAAIFTPMTPFEDRLAAGITYDQVLNQLRARLAAIPEAFIVVISPPPVRGIGNAGGFRMMVQDRSSRGVDVLQQAAFQLAGQANAQPGLTSVFTFFETSTPQLYADIDRTKA
ncbi:MAG: efflux RND transporter permease subunit, partial [Maricaulaceae bacterium]